MEIHTCCPVSGEFADEEKLNYVTHFFGLILGICGCTYLLFNATNEMHFISSGIYSMTLILLYASSTYYHAALNLPRKRFLKMADHCCIYLLIAGSYTPYTLGPLWNTGGWEMFCLIWSIAFLGILFKLFARDRFKTFSVLAYVGMGWLVAFNLTGLIESLSWQSFSWLIGGGILYTVGTFFYMWEDLPFNHAIWHLFVLGGSVSHFLSILYIVA